MNLEELKSRPPAVGKFDWRGGPVWLRKLSAVDYVELSKVQEESKTDADSVAFHVEVVRRSLCDEQGTLLAGDVTGFLRQDVSFAELLALSEQVYEFSSPEKKTDSLAPKDSPTKSA